MTWLSINKNEMMRNDFNSFLLNLKIIGDDYTTYDAGKNKLYIKISKKAFGKLDSSWFFYHPISVLKNKPDVSDFDIVKDMSS